MKVCHITSAHPQHDVRILIKECCSIAQKYDTSLIVVNGKNETYNNVNIFSIECTINSRFDRFTKAVNLTLKKAIEINADIYHIHDPELLRIVPKLKKLNKKVIYDVHEDLPRQILSKPWINVAIRKAIANTVEWYENKISKKCDGIITATPFIEKRFSTINKNTITINNFPLTKELQKTQSNFKECNSVCYIGGISQIRGIKQMINSLSSLNDITLLLAGKFSSKRLKEEISSLDGWKNVKELGQISREESITIKKQSFAGLILFLPVPNHINAQPNKMFEYMASGIPVIASNFPLWKEIIDNNNCGICVDPLNNNEIINAITLLRKNPELAKKMGGNGIKMVNERYNWEKEAIKLLHFYQKLK